VLHVGDAQALTADAAETANYNPATATVYIDVSAAAIEITASAHPNPINEGGSTTLSGSFSDTGVTGTHTVSIAWNDGNTDTVVLAADVRDFSVPHPYADNLPGNAPYVIGVTVTESNGLYASTTTSVTVNDVPPAPTIAGIPSGNTCSAETAINLVAQPHDPGLHDTFTYHWWVSASNGQVIVDGSSATYSFTLNAAGTYTVGLTVTDNDGLAGSTSATITALPATFHVINFTPNPSGFDVQFNRPADSTSLHLYCGRSQPVHTSDVIVIGPSGKAIHGSLLWNAANNTASFVATNSADNGALALGGVWAAGTYYVTLPSGSEGWVDTGAELLDGNSDGTEGDAYSTSFVVDPWTSPVVRLPDFARGPDQSVDVPATGAGLPVRISDGSGVQSIRLTLHYDSSLLAITAATLGGAVPGDWTVTSFDLSVPNQVTLAASGAESTSLPTGECDVFKLTTRVPAAARYGASQILAISSLQLNAGTLAGIADRAFQKVAFLGDATGNRGYSALDASLIARTDVGLDTGFDAFPLVDPVIVGDATGDGGLSGLDATYVARTAVGLPQPQVPALPAGNVPGLPGVGLDPVISMPSSIVAQPGTVCIVPVNIDGPAGLESFDLAFSYDTKLLDLGNADVKLTGLMANDWSLAVNVDDAQGVARVSGSASTPLSESSGTFLELAFHVPLGAGAGTSILAVTAARGGGLNEGALPITPVDGSIIIQDSNRGSFPAANIAPSGAPTGALAGLHGAIVAGKDLRTLPAPGQLAALDVAAVDRLAAEGALPTATPPVPSVTSSRQAPWFRTRMPPIDAATAGSALLGREELLGPRAAEAVDTLFAPSLASTLNAKVRPSRDSALLRIFGAEGE
jgi:hypothetical protein